MCSASCCWILCCSDMWRWEYRSVVATLRCLTKKDALQKIVDLLAEWLKVSKDEIRKKIRLTIKMSMDILKWEIMSSLLK